MRRFLVSSLALCLVAGCRVTDPSARPPQLADLPRALTENEQRVSRAANQFALTLFKQLNEAQPGDNVFVSPLSVSFSLGMAMNGADGQTLDEMRSTLGFGAADLAEVNDGYRGLMSLQAGLDPSTTFTIANSVWYRHNFPFHSSFVDTVKRVFDADARPSPFDAGTIKAVNDWVSASTRGKIPEILERIDRDDVMFLINAIYFKGSWRDRFDPSQTTDQPFHALGGPQTVKMMHRSSEQGTLRFNVTPELMVGELVYGNSAFVMTIVMPHSAAGTDAHINTVAASLDTAKWAALVADMPERAIEVRLPKLRLEYARELSADLKGIGMRVPFEAGSADFTRMSPLGRELFIAFVQHKTFVDVNEEGTEAAAVTNTGVRVTSAPPCLCVDRPFIFAIRERFSGTILFMGKIVRIP